MESNFKREAGAAHHASTTARPGIRFQAILVVIACSIFSLALLWLNRAPKLCSGTARVPDSMLVPVGNSSNQEDPAGFQTDPGQGASLVRRSELSQPARPNDSVPRPEPTPESRRLVAALVRWEPRGGELTPDQAAAWKQRLEELVAQGPAGVLAIQEFLSQNREYDFGPAAKEALGYSSARTALFGALVQIGGPEAINAMTEVLQTTADPREIALLAQDLEKMDPGQHRQEVLEAARQTLQMAGAKKVELSDTAPLFEVLQKYGGSGVVTDLERATGQWNYYATIALAQLPEDAGIPSLVQLAQDPKSSGSVRDAALQMLAQVADRSADARSTLLALGRQNQMSIFTWQMVASALAGDQVGLLNSAFEDHQALSHSSGLRTVATSDNQNFFALPGSLTPEQTNQRLALIDDLLAGSGDPQVRQLLQQSSTLLRNRLSLAPLAASGQ